MLYPDEARVPETLRTDEFLLRRSRATDVALDYDAVISSRADLLLGSGGTWPREGFTLLIAQKIEERYIQLFEEMGLRLLYSLRPHQPFLDVALAYLLESDPVRTIQNG